MGDWLAAGTAGATQGKGTGSRPAWLAFLPRLRVRAGCLSPSVLASHVRQLEHEYEYEFD